VEKSLKTLGERLEAADRARVESQISDLRAAMGGEDANRIRQSTQALQQVASTLAQQAASGDGDRGPGGTPPTSSDDIVEGEYTEV
jgi:molecular chaperone DnaK